MTEQAQGERLRPHPEPRFAAAQHRFDLAAVAGRLRQECQAGEDGHRQETLYKRGPTTVALFVFGHLTCLSEHRTNGVVVIEVLRGHLQVTAEDQVHDLRVGHLLVLAPNVRNKTVAYEETEMLLTVHLEAAAG